MRAGAKQSCFTRVPNSLGMRRKLEFQGQKQVAVRVMDPRSSERALRSTLIAGA